MSLGKVERPSSLAVLAYDTLHAAILTGEISVGERPSIVALAERLGMSRSPIRAAVERLANEGLVSVGADGVEVIELSNDDLVDLLTLRSVLEGLAARLAASRIDTDVIDRLEAIHRDFSAAVQEDDTKRARQVDLDFHRTIQNHSENRWLIEDLRRLQSRVIVATYTNAWTPSQHEAVGEHSLILAGLRAGRADEAESAAVNHIENLIRRIVESGADDEASPR